MWTTMVNIRLWPGNVIDALWLTYAILCSLSQASKASAGLADYHDLRSVHLLEEGENLVIPKGGRKEFHAKVDPPEAADECRFLWSLSGVNRTTYRPSFSKEFRETGVFHLSVRAENRISAVDSQRLRIKVVEEIHGVRGVVYPTSVQVNRRWSFTVLVNHGSDITYHWDFGDGKTKVTRQEKAKHRYVAPGEYLLKVVLRNLVSEETVTERVFVLKNGIECDTPRIIAFYPEDQTRPREVGPQKASKDFGVH
ncbi:polycystin-1-like protein 1 [Oratosquilla oratoria]|uniref:polycystin-1-like protein 1 n=1 Tax=Oratosquilla oratoria TaxID=337810 RepID=UPI003F76E4B5